MEETITALKEHYSGDKAKPKSEETQQLRLTYASRTRLFLQTTCWLFVQDPSSGAERKEGRASHKLCQAFC